MIKRSLIILIALGSIIFFGPQALKMLHAKNECEEAVLNYAMSDSKGNKEQLKQNYQSICERMNIQADFYLNTHVK